MIQQRRRMGMVVIGAVLLWGTVAVIPAEAIVLGDKVAMRQRAMQNQLRALERRDLDMPDLTRQMRGGRLNSMPRSNRRRAPRSAPLDIPAVNRPDRTRLRNLPSATRSNLGAFQTAFPRAR